MSATATGGVQLRTWSWVLSAERVARGARHEVLRTGDCELRASRVALR